MENKRAYIKPVLESETFVPQNYIAACGDTEYGKYLFTCDAPGGKLYYYNDRGKAQYIGNYTPCSEKHQASMASEFPDGFIDYNRNEREDDGEAVVVWIERGWWGSISNAHATTNLNRESWETVKS
jgi:hypothetical protein